VDDQDQVEKKKSKWNLNVSRLYKEDLENKQDVGDLTHSQFTSIISGKEHPITQGESKDPDLYDREHVFHRF